MKLPPIGWIYELESTPDGVSMEVKKRDLIYCEQCRHSCGAAAEDETIDMNCNRLIDQGISFKVDQADFCSWAEKEEE